ncbi:MAG TPA: tRNA (uridine(54)-C5)-methyltransferase TrmA [Thauera sp.]|nr:tRNA (uridine(54)-C5)-methyltransferase TrmA [Thauera sp.]HRA81390.1 tRNA (uridine(54)-C5)-methyltransferase TrmA [Thauera sp.]
MSLNRIDPAQYEAQLADKLAALRQNFAGLALPEPEVFRSTPLHYRMRAEFRLWHHDGRIDYAMFESAEGEKKVVLIETFPALTKPICDLMPRLRDCLQESEVLRNKLFQVEFLATLSGELMVCLIYHRALDDEWTAQAQALVDRFGVNLIGRSRKQKIVLGRDWLLERFELDGRALQYQQIEGSFTQPNVGVNRQMLGWACRQVADAGGDLLELYCGNGNFTIALAPAFDRVLATEVSKSSVAAAHYNLDANRVDNVTLVRMSSDEISDALAGGREYLRMKDVALDSYRFSTLFVDPPRSGLDAATVELARGFERILYISCNPATLRDNVAALHDTHEIVAAAVFDQFPYTHHLESGLLLRRRLVAD